MVAITNRSRYRSNPARSTAESQIEVNREKLALLANRLLAQETLEARELEKILAGEGATQIA